MFPRASLPTVHDALTALYRAAGCQPNVVQEAIQMQTIVNLGSAELGVAWVPASVQQFQRHGVVYRSVATPEIPAGTQGVPMCETSLVWLDRHMTPALGRWMAFVQGQLHLSM
jgi:DNA-binding transcriptional LysR family regulator